MATTLSTHSLHLQQHLQQSSIGHHHLSFNHHHHHIQIQQQQQQKEISGHFCNDCGVMFESSTSLEVHLSYHKENLLSRWGTQDSSSSASSVSSGIHSNNSNISVSSSSSNPTSMEKTMSHTPSPQASVDSISSSSGPVSSQPNTHQYFLDFVPAHYTSDHHMEPPSSRPGNNNNNNFQPPVDPHLYGSIHHQPHQYGSQQQHPNHLYSPASNDPNGSSSTPSSNNNNNNNTGGNNLNNSGPPPPSGDPQHQRPPPTSGENPATREPAEILDLDSQKVHVYQQQHDRNFFHRPYLPHLLPPLPPSNGWHDQFNPIGFPPPPDHHLGPSSRHPYSIPPPIQPGGNPYELIRGEPNPIYSNDPPSSSMGYGSPTGPQPPNNNNTNSVLSNPPSHGTNGIRGGFNIGNNSGVGGVPPSDRTRSPPHRSPPISTGNGGMSKSSSAPAAAPKTKGWKGGECKRPKTYNCSACNKWFTSSGHLKRHYGTTLHKNSIRQKGEGVEEPVKGSNGKRSPGDSLPSGGGDLATESSPTSSPSPRSIKLEDMNSGKSTPSSSSIQSGPMPSMYGSSTSSSQPTTLSTPIPFNNSNNSSSTTTTTSSISGNHIPGGVPSPNSTGSTGTASAGVGISNSSYGTTGPSPYPPMSPYSNSTTSGGGQQQGPPSAQQQQQPYIPGHGNTFHQVPHQLHSTGLAFSSNGYGPESSLYSIPSPIVPTTLYGGYSVLNGDTPTPLPPFSTVGFSHYDPNSYHHLPPPPQQQHTLMVSGYATPTSMASMASPNRMTPSHQPYLPPSSPNLNNNNNNSNTTNTTTNGSSANGNNNINNNNNHLEHNSFDSENHHNRDSPEEIRSASTTASADGSLDGLEGCSDGASPNRDSSGESTKGEDEGVLKCKDCTKTFGRACYLTQHANSSHSEKKFKCSTCGKRFPEAPALSEHVAKHGNIKPYSCNLCPKNFNHKTDLRRHLCLHTGEKPFKCGFCNKGFIRKDHMSKHITTHKRKM